MLRARTGADLRLTEVQIERRLLCARAKKRDVRNASFVRLGLKSNRESCALSIQGLCSRLRKSKLIGQLVSKEHRHAERALLRLGNRKI
jgi:hypothetical protein